TAVLMKQQAVVFVPLGVVPIAWHAWGMGSARWTTAAAKVGMLCLGTLLPLGIVTGILYWQGVLDRCWFWTVRYAKEYVSEVPLSFAWTTLSDRLNPDHRGARDNLARALAARGAGAPRGSDPAR